VTRIRFEEVSLHYRRQVANGVQHYACIEMISLLDPFQSNTTPHPHQSARSTHRLTRLHSRPSSRAPTPTIRKTTRRGSNDGRNRTPVVIGRQGRRAQDDAVGSDAAIHPRTDGRLGELCVCVAFQTCCRNQGRPCGYWRAVPCWPRGRT